MASSILLLACPTEIEQVARHSALAHYYTIQAVCDLRQPEVVSLVREAALLVVHEQVALRDLPQVCAHLRRQTRRPMVVALDQGDEAASIAVLEAGADDCVPEPLSAGEWVARLRAHLRRDQEYAAAALAPYEAGDLQVDPARHEVWVRQQPVSLTPREFELLECLCESAGRAIPRDELLQRVWGYNSGMSTRTLDVHVGRLRQKIEQDPPHPQFVITVPGVGYKLAT